ncbi:MAG: DNA repair protein RecN [Christensenellales bacterium]
MLESIRITNLALISKSSVDFSDGFNVLTGETGAGKSLIVDALVFLTGVRADKTFIKSGEEFSRVEGVFSVDTNDIKINDVLNSVGLENEGTLIISRQFNLSGKNECRINGELVTLNVIRKLSSLIIDIFGQNDSQVLLDSNNHLQLLDNMFEDSLLDDKVQLREMLDKLALINNSIKELGGLDSDREKNIQFIEFQIKEIDDANLEIGQEEELKSKILTMQNSEKIYSALNSATEILDGEYSIENAIKTAINSIASIENFDSELVNQKDRLYSIRYELQDIVSELTSKKESIVYSEQDLDILQDKLMSIKDLERKYGNTIEEILKTRDELNFKLQKLLNADEELERLRLNKNNLLKSIYDICIKLHNTRVNELKSFREKLLNELKELGMKNADFAINFLNDITLNNIESIVGENGADKIEFLFSANLGVEPRPLDKIISGGEMSRFMLSFKSLQNSNSKKTCIFDEIDTGIGGEIGVEIGKKIVNISKNTQVICITHLAQIASFGDNNYLIEKSENENFTITSVKHLNNDEKIIEIARMLGNSSNESSIKLSKEMIDNANGYKNFLSSK